MSKMQENKHTPEVINHIFDSIQMFAATSEFPNSIPHSSTTIFSINFNLLKPNQLYILLIDLPLSSCSTANLADTFLRNSAQSNYSKEQILRSVFKDDQGRW